MTSPTSNRAIVMVTELKTRISRFFAERREEKRRKVNAAENRRLWPSCPACGGEMAGHHVWLLASAILGSPTSRAGELSRLIEHHQWESAMQINEWKGTRDERMYYIVRCPKISQLTLSVVISFFDLWLDDYVEFNVRLDDESTQTILRLADNHWEAFD